jgi:N-formylglutamate amidohydrolase
MDGTCLSTPFEIRGACGPRRPVVVASPHSGSDYPAEFVAASRLAPLTLRSSEDCYVDEVFGLAPAAGAPLLRALFPRAYVDVNRGPYELDPAMFEDDLPDFVQRASPRVSVGLGTLARVVAEGEQIYNRKLRFAEAEARIAFYYRPYHAALEALVADTASEFGCCLLIDAHSMPSGTAREPGRQRVDVVLGDRMGTSCHSSVTRAAERLLRRRGYSVALNAPYAGGFTTRHYGRPVEGRHCLQVEINRALYMDEKTLERKPALAALAADMAELVRTMAELAQDQLAAALPDAAQ